jgi:hypothetical protein
LHDNRIDDGHVQGVGDFRVQPIHRGRLRSHSINWTQQEKYARDDERRDRRQHLCAQAMERVNNADDNEKQKNEQRDRKYQND